MAAGGLLGNLIAASAASTLGSRQRGGFKRGQDPRGGLATLLAGLPQFGGGRGFRRRPAPDSDLAAQFGGGLLQQILRSRLGGTPFNRDLSNDLILRDNRFTNDNTGAGFLFGGQPRPRPAPEFFSPPFSPFIGGPNFPVSDGLNPPVTPPRIFAPEFDPPPTSLGGGLAGLPFEPPAPLVPVRQPSFQAEGVGPPTLVPSVSTGGQFGGTGFAPGGPTGFSAQPTIALGIPPGPPPSFQPQGPIAPRGGPRNLLF